MLLDEKKRKGFDKVCRLFPRKAPQITQKAKKANIYHSVLILTKVVLFLKSIVEQRFFTARIIKERTRFCERMFALKSAPNFPNLRMVVKE